MNATVSPLLPLTLHFTVAIIDANPRMQTTHSGFNGHAHDPATEQTILTASEAQPPAYDAIPVTHYHDHPNQPGLHIVLQLIGFVVLCFILYNFVRVISTVEQARTTPG